MDKDILNALDDFVPAPGEGFLGNSDGFISIPKNYKNLYLYVNRDQLFSILESLALKLSRTERTNDTTENIFAGENQVHAEVREYGYVCLTSTIISPMMWGQYADRGKGACLVFSGEFEKRANSIIGMTEYLDRREGKGKMAKISIYQVQYESDRVTEKSDVKKVMSTKSKCWEHEKEYRIIVPLNNSTPIEDTDAKDSSKFFSYTYLYSDIMPALSRIVLGVNNDLDIVDFQRKVNSACSCSANNGRTPDGITQKFPVIVTKATMDDNKFEINPHLSDLPPISRIDVDL